MPSMAAGSDIGLGGVDGASLLGGPSFRYDPAVKASDKWFDIDM